MTGPALVEATRRDVRTGRERVESVHAGHLVVLDADGGVRAAGDPGHATFVRSTAKPFQAAACLELLEGADDPVSAAEVAVAWASHRGERAHLQAVERLLARSGTAADQLTCPPDSSEADPGAGPARIRHNCSGKHALFAVAGRRLGVDRERLLDVDAALQHAVLAALEDAFGPPRAVGADGCGAPAVAVPLVALARSYAALLTHDRWARVRQAGFAHPSLVGGEGRLESALLAHGVVAKVGAEGVFAAGWRDADGQPRACAVKVADGAARAAATAVWAVLVDLGVVASDVWTPPHPRAGDGRGGSLRAVFEVDALVPATDGGASGDWYR